MQKLRLLNLISVFVGVFVALSLHSQTIESITFSSVVSSSDNFQPIVGTPYGVSLTGANGSIEISASYGEGSYAQGTLLIDESKPYRRLNVFPNPTSYLINIDLGFLPEGEYKICIFDVNGNEIYNQKSLNHLQHIDFSQYSSGTYNLSVKSEKTSQIEKVKIIKHK